MGRDRQEEEPLGEAPLPENTFRVSLALRRTVLRFVGAVFFVLLALLVWSFWDTRTDTDPTKMQLIYLLVGFAVAFGICMLEWEKFKFRILKIGPVEFQQIVSAQAEERETELSEVWKRLEELEAKQVGDGKLASRSPFQEVDELKPLLETFLDKNRRYSFSPLRIKKLESKKLANYEAGDIRRALREMADEGTVERRVSQKGNTIFRIARG